jgi:flagellar L-ring protein FlgH
MNCHRKCHIVQTVLVLLAGLFASACSSRLSHIEPYEPRVRDYQLPVDVETLAGGRERGSLWAQTDDANYLYTDQRAIRVGDLLTIRVEEFATAQRNASTQLSRESRMNAQVRAFLGVIQGLNQILPEGIDPSQLLDTESGNSFSGSGETNRSEQLQATVQVMVRQVLPNGNLFVEGHRVILVNNEEHHFYVSGVARPSDIDETNALASSRLADAEIEFTGRGAITDQQRAGGLQRVFGRIWPF